MANKAIVYSKQTGEPCIPATVRIEWLADGTIKPLKYWMPDGSRYEIKHVYERTLLAFLKDRAEGIRFKVQAVVTDTSEPYSDYQFTNYETYLYFADNRFCGKNFIDSRYSHAGKEYIPVTLDVFPDGDYELVYFKAQGTRYMVERTHAVEPRGSFHAGGVGIWHKVEARQVNDDNDESPDTNKNNIRMAAVYLEIDKWFVSVKTGTTCLVQKQEIR